MKKKTIKIKLLKYYSFPFSFYFLFSSVSSTEMIVFAFLFKSRYYFKSHFDFIIPYGVCFHFFPHQTSRQALCPSWLSPSASHLAFLFKERSVHRKMLLKLTHLQQKMSESWVWVNLPIDLTCLAWFYRFFAAVIFWIANLKKNATSSLYYMYAITMIVLCTVSQVILELEHMYFKLMVIYSSIWW